MQRERDSVIWPVIKQANGQVRTNIIGQVIWLLASFPAPPLCSRVRVACRLTHHAIQSVKKATGASCQANPFAPERGQEVFMGVRDLIWNLQGERRESEDACGGAYPGGGC